MTQFNIRFYKKQKDFTIIIHSSERTKGRLHVFLDSYLLDKPHIHYFVVFSNSAHPDPNYSYLLAPCDDLRASLSCKNQYAYEYFLRNPSLGDFLYRAMDDTYLNISNLERLIQDLRQIYNPEEYLVFRGYANDEKRRCIFLGGGSGWLMSRAMVRVHTLKYLDFNYNNPFSYYLQDDTTETLILTKIGFKNMETWFDHRWAENAAFDRGIQDYLSGDFSFIPKCRKTQKITPLKDMIAMHSTRHYLKIIWKNSKDYPDNLYYYKFKNSQSGGLCRSTPGIIDERTTLEYLQKNAEFISFSDVANREPIPSLGRANCFLKPEA